MNRLVSRRNPRKPDRMPRVRFAFCLTAAVLLLFPPEAAPAEQPGRAEAPTQVDPGARTVARCREVAQVADQTTRAVQPLGHDLDQLVDLDQQVRGEQHGDGGETDEELHGEAVPRPTARVEPLDGLEPLEGGEYAIVDFTPGELDLRVWAFSHQPGARAGAR